MVDAISVSVSAIAETGGQLVQGIHMNEIVNVFFTFFTILQVNFFLDMGDQAINFATEKAIEK